MDQGYAMKWAQGKISDSDYFAGIRYLIQHGFLERATQAQTAPVSSNIIQQPKNCQDRNFPKVDWHGCNFSGAQLSHIEISNSNLEGVNLSYANLYKAYAVNAALKHAIWITLI